jgi:hypothetical protein
MLVFVLFDRGLVKLFIKDFFEKNTNNWFFKHSFIFHFLSGLIT